MSEQKDKIYEDDVASEILENLRNAPVEVIDPKKNSGSSGKKFYIIFFVLIILAGTGFAAWKFLLQKDNKTDQQAANTQPIQANNQDISSEPSLSQDYTSDRLLVDFKYPDDWTVDEDTGDIIISSPEIEVDNIKGEPEKAVFRIFIKQGADKADSEYLGRGLAIKKSESINYSDPSASQRKKTLITQFGLDSSNNFAYFVVQGNFDLKKDETLGPNYAHEVDAILISGGFYRDEADGDPGFIMIDPDACEQDQNYKTAVEIVKSIKLR